MNGFLFLPVTIHHLLMYRSAAGSVCVPGGSPPQAGGQSPEEQPVPAGPAQAHSRRLARPCRPLGVAASHTELPQRVQPRQGDISNIWSIIRDPFPDIL